MCYSAEIKADYKKLCRHFGAIMSLKEFAKLWLREDDRKSPKAPKAMGAMFSDDESLEGQAIWADVQSRTSEQITAIEQDLFAQTKRLADAQRALQTKVTKKAQNDERVATNKIAQFKGKLADLKRSELKRKDFRIFPGMYAPVLIVEDGQRKIVPMRYQCRPDGKPANYDHKYPGTYNARRDNLDGFWKSQFGYHHGLMVVTAFYENVSRHTMEGRSLAEGEKEENVILEFRPEPEQEMLVACLWSRWRGPDGEELLSFAAITDEPPPEVAAAGHDRCIINIRQENVEAWLNPDASRTKDLQDILDDKARPYYEHRIAA